MLESRILHDVKDLHRAFTRENAASTTTSVLDLARTALDFRAGKPREETPWGEGVAISPRQKQAVLQIAEKWNMLKTSHPTRPFDSIVVLGAHNSSLSPRIKHAVGIQEQHPGNVADFILLNCYRPIHPKEGVDSTVIDTEADLAVTLLQDALGRKFESGTVTVWEDLPHDTEKMPGEYAVATVGRIGLQEVTSISGSIPGESVRATTISTLESLKTHLDGSSPRLLFVTTSLHLPYQTLQIDRAMQGFDTEVVGVGYDSLQNMSLSSPDSQFRMVLQEIGATIKNCFGSQKASSI